MANDFRINGIFPCPVYRAHRDSDLELSEKKEIKGIVEEGGMHQNKFNSTSNSSHIFNTRLYNLKEFCENHIKIYVNEIINPENELDFYITQSWLNVTKPGEKHHKHNHQNSLISGVFYIATVEDDKIMFYDSEDRQTRLRIRCEFDGITQSQFFRMMLTGYVENDELIYDYIKKCKEKYEFQGQQKRNTVDRIKKKSEEISKKFVLGNDEIEDIFDIIEMETDL